MINVGLFDWLMWAIYFVLIALACYLYRSSKRDDLNYSYFLPAFFIKIFGGLAFVIMYIYYYKGGDTIEYFQNSSVLFDALFESPSDYLKLMTQKHGEFAPDLVKYTSHMGYYSGSEEWFMVRTISIINNLGMNSILVTTLLISFLSFLGSWKLFQVFTDYVKNPFWAFAAVFLTPSVIFWGSGILKDTMVIFTLNLMIWYYHQIIFHKRVKWHYMALFLILAYATFRFKSYVLILFIPAMLIGIYLRAKSLIRSAVVRFIVTPLLFIGLALVAFQGVVYLSKSSGKYDLNGIEKKVKGFHSWHQYQGGSVYNLGEIEYTPLGVVKKIPASLNVTLFRPYIWEANNLVMFLGAFESLIIVFLFLRLLLFKTRNIGQLFKSPFFVMMLIFILLLGFVVGFTSFNFGALARYKIPIMGMVSFLLLALNFDANFKGDIAHKKLQ